MRYLTIMFAAFAVFACLGRPNDRSMLKQDSRSPMLTTNRTSPIDGVYEFVSRTTTDTGPQLNIETAAAPEWYGLWLFHEGYFSQTRMKNVRPDWTPARFPASPEGLGFDGSSGTYVVEGDVIRLKHMVKFYPAQIGAVQDLAYSLDNNILTLTWKWLPGPHHSTTGQRITVLRKIK